MIPLALFVVLGPVAGFLLLAGLPVLRRSGLAAGVVSSAVALATLVAAIVLLVGVEPGAAPVIAQIDWLPHQGEAFARLGVRVDGTSAVMGAVVALIASAVQVYSLGYMASEGRPSIGRYFAWQSLFLFSMQTLVFAPDLLQAFLGWELVGLCSYLLIGFYYQKPSAAKAAVKAFWVTKFADMGLLTGLVLMRWQVGSFAWEAVQPGWTATAIALLVFLGAMGKSAQFPLHVWLPDAMEGPTPVSALLHAATMVAAGVYLVVRTWPLFEASGVALHVVAWVGAITVVVAGLTAMVQDDIKKVLAYSTCSQLGYMVAALGAGSPVAGLFHLTNHAFFKALLFLAAGAAIHAVHSNSIWEMGGLWRSLKGASLLFLVGAAALIGLPGFSGFFSKDFALEALAESHLWGPFALALGGVALTGFYVGRVVVVAFFRRPAKERGRLHTPLVMTVPMTVLAVLAVVGGLLGGPIAGWLGGAYHFHVTPEGLTATVLALGGLGLATWIYGYEGGRRLVVLAAPAGAFIRSGLLDRFYETAWRQGLLVVAHAAGWFDRYVVDGVMNLVAWSVLEGSERTRRIQTGRIPDYVLAVVVAFVVLAAWGAVSGMSGCGSTP
ncbi:MAG: NADH-quinone oxidoreductase subunit L [Deltaproteobacteria bacterium]|nr:NADH-quinone oxidoreductase subunit L [Deltaproteobacteria bacterium]